MPHQFRTQDDSGACTDTALTIAKLCTYMHQLNINTNTALDELELIHAALIAYLEDPPPFASNSTTFERMSGVWRGVVNFQLAHAFIAGRSLQFLQGYLSIVFSTSAARSIPEVISWRRTISLLERKIKFWTSTLTTETCVLYEEFFGVKWFPEPLSWTDDEQIRFYGDAEEVLDQLDRMEGIAVPLYQPC